MRQPSRRRFIKVAGTASVITSIAGCSGSGNSGSGDGGSSDGSGSGTTSGGAATTTTQMSQLEKWAAKGKKEENGQVNIAHFQAGETANAFFSAFEEKIPWLNINGIKFSGNELAPRYEAEYRSGNTTMDIVWSPIISVLAGEGMTVNLKEKLPAWSGMPEGAKGENWFPFKTSAYGMYYNSDLISKGELPTTWADLTDPQYKGKIIIGQSFDYVFPGLKWVVDNNPGWLEAMGKQDVQWASGLGAAVKQMAAGQRALDPFTNLKYEWIEGRAKGTPAKIATPTEPVFLIVNPAGVNDKAPHYNSAMYLANFLATDEGQKTIAENVHNECAGLTKDTLKCDPNEMNQILHNEVDKFQFVSFLDKQEYNDLAKRVQDTFGL